MDQKYLNKPQKRVLDDAEEFSVNNDKCLLEDTSLAESFFEHDEYSHSMPKLKKIKPNKHESIVEVQPDLKPVSIKLTIELVPKTSWFDNVRTNISSQYWKKLSKTSLEKAGHQCEICEANGTAHRKLECHEIWNFDDASKIQKLSSLITLCHSCHETKHIGLAEKNGRLDVVKSHLTLINNWTSAQVNKYVDEAFLLWRKRSQHQWHLDISWIETQGIPLIKKTTEKQATPNKLKTAIEMQNLAEIQSILAKLSEAEINRLVYTADNKRKLNPLHEVIVSNNDKDFSQELLAIPQLKLYINDADKYGETPLFYAVKNKNLDLVYLLLMHGAKVSAVSSHKKTVLHHALNNKDINCFSLLLEFDMGELYHTYDNWDKLPFHSLCKTDIEDKDKDNHKENDEIQIFCKLLVPHLTKAEITMIDKYKKTLLHYAVSILTQEHLEYLFDHGANEVVHIADKYGKTALHQAAKWGNVAALKLILINGGKNLINQADNYKKTPIHEAAIYGRREIIHLLLENGADFETKSFSGEPTAFEEATANKNLGVTESFALFSPYMDKTEEEKRQYLNELLVKEEEQKHVLVPEAFTKRFPWKRKRSEPHLILSSHSIERSIPKQNTTTRTGIITDNKVKDSTIKTFRQPNITESIKTKINPVKVGRNPFVLLAAPKKNIEKEVLLPSQIKLNEGGMYWISDKGNDSEKADPSNVGKWLLYFSSSTVDRAWDIVKKGIQTGNLWQAKVSTNDERDRHVVVVYTKDYTDIEDVIRVHDYLTEKQLRHKSQDIYYKSDEQTRAGVYSGTSSKQKPWIYSSSTIEKSRIDFKKREVLPRNSFNVPESPAPK